jgi:hypothetical protein
MAHEGPELWGCDFTSAPSRRKPIVLAVGRLRTAATARRLELLHLDTFDSLSSWEARLQAPGHWVGGLDLPFGWPRELVQAMGWPEGWADCMRHCATLDRATLRAHLAAFCAARPTGHKFAHRATDGPAGSSPSMKWVNPPVALMLHAGVPALLRAGVQVPGMHAGDPRRVALEAYPGLLARQVLGARSYKSDQRQRQTPERLLARKDLLHALETGAIPLLHRMQARLALSHANRDALIDDPQGDALDAVLCLVQAAWAWVQHASGHPCYGLPPFDPLEGWIVGAGA